MQKFCILYVECVFECRHKHVQKFKGIFIWLRLFQKEKIKAKTNEHVMIQKYQQKFKQAMGLSGDDDASTD